MNKPTNQELEAALAALVKAHGWRVRRKQAMKLLCIEDRTTFRKIVDANPRLAHKLKGEVQPKYLTVEIFALLPTSAWCATCGEGSKQS